MLADPRRIRLLVTGGLILLAAVALRLITGGPGEPPPAAAPTPVVAEAEPEARDGSAPEHGRLAERDEPDVDDAHRVAADFAREYLRWSADEPHADRTERLAAHATRDFASELAEARPLGTADAEELEDGWSQTVEVLETQTLTVRGRSVEVGVMSEVTATDEDGRGRTPTSLTVVLREEADAWRVDDLR
jgi:hypothetical protein